MQDLSKYRLVEKLSENGVSFIFRAVRLEDNMAVVVKTRRDDGSQKQLVDLEHEYAIIKRLEHCSGVIRAYAFERFDDHPVIILEDIGGESLEKMLEKRKPDLEQCLRIAINITSCISQIHSTGIIHRNLNPSNILVNGNSGQVKIIDFGLASETSNDGGPTKLSTGLVGALAYISPECTGRLNLKVDYRSDYYSLGITLYDLFTGRLPFESTDPLELVHCHIASKPLSPTLLNPDIPDVISDIILRLIEKKPENRYQSAFGIIMDLELCLDRLIATGQIEPFDICLRDVPEKLVISSRIYGRRKESASILDAFDRTRAGGKELVMVSGRGGIGKTSLVNGLQGIISGRRGYFVSGKFDQLHRNILDNAVLYPFRELVNQLLSESDEKLAQWRNQFMEALAPNCQVIIDIIPELELIIGPQPPALKLEPMESENRFKLEFQNFLSVFCRSEHPITLFLDDVQWADVFSLKLLEFMLTDQDTKFILVIVSYRDEEVDLSHPFMSTLEALQKHGIRTDSIQLGPLEIEHSTELVADTLRTQRKAVSELASLIHHKTQGNPFFLKEFLKSMYEEKIVEFDYFSGSWKWDASRIVGRDVTKNVVALLEDRISRLPAFCRNLIKVGACIGNKFDLDSLSWFFNEPADVVERQLSHAVNEGLIYSFNDGYSLSERTPKHDLDRHSAEYKFAHDRIQQTCYSLISDDEKPSFHRKLGLAILNNTSENQIEGRLLEIVTHLNLATDPFDSSEDRVYLAELNLRAGKKAKQSIAYEIALYHFRLGAALLGDSGWNTNYELKLELLVEATVASFLTAKFDEMDELGAEVVKHGRTLLDTIKVYEVQIQAHIAQNARLMAVRTALPVLRLLGQKFPDEPSRINVLKEMLKTRIILFGHEIDSLSELPRMTNPENLATMRLLRNVISAAYTVAPELFALMIFRMVQLSVKSGLAKESALAFAAYAMVIMAIMDDVDLCLKYGELALKMARNEYFLEDQTRVTFVVYSFIKTRNSALRDGFKPLLDNYHVGRELGDFEYAAVSAAFYCTHSYGAGSHLPELEKEVSKLARSIGKMNQDTTKFLVEVYHQEILNMMEPTEDPCLLRGKACDEATMLPVLTEARESSIICAIHVQKLRLCYLFRDYKTAFENYEKAKRHLEGAKGSMLAPIIFFYGSLAGLGLFENLDRRERKRTLKEVSRNQRALQKWASRAPMNFMHKFHLVEAERFMCLKRYDRAIDHYETAIQMAGANGYVNEEALANERAAMLFLTLNKRSQAKYYVQESVGCYLKWGAFAKVKDLTEKYSDLLGTDQRWALKNPENTPTQEKEHDIDLEAVIRASQNISGEIVFERLLEKLMNIVIQIGGAEKALLLMEAEGAQQVKASAFSNQDADMVQKVAYRGFRLEFSEAIVNYVSRTKKPIILDDATNDHRFANDRYVKFKLPKSVCCIPVVRGGELTGVLYMENNQTEGVFTPKGMEMLNVLASQAATSIQNAVLYRDLDETARRYQSLIQNAQEAIFITDERRVKFCNPKMAELSGYSAEALIDRNMTDLVFPDDQNIFLEQQDQSLHSSSEPFIRRFRIIRKDQSIIWAQNNSVLILWDGKPSVLNFLTDITQIKLAGDLQIRTERLKAIGELASGVAHNFNNLLQILLGGVELSLMDLESGKISKVQSSLEQIRNSIKLGSETVKRLQSFAGIRSPNLTSDPKVFDISDSLRQAFDITRPLWKTSLERNDVSVTVKLETAPECFVHGNESEFFEVFINLIKNAVEAMPNGGMITASSEILDKSVLIRIQDTGKGIPDHDLEKMFEPFWSSKGAAGTGLGLSVSRNIVIAHGGSISAESKLGRGTSFIIRVPLAEAGLEKIGDYSDEIKTGPLTVLVIDDSRPIVTLLEDLLTAYGQTVLGACSGVEGVRLFDDNHVDIVICDLGMPDMSGWEVGRKIVSISAQRGVSKPPFLLLTGWGGQTLEHSRLKESGVDGVMEKPIDAKRLFGLLQKVTHRSLSNENS